MNKTVSDRSNPVVLGFLLSITLLVLFAAWGLFGLTESPGFILDEPEMIDAANSFAQSGHFSVKSAGPGAAHEDTYLYQLPPYPLLLGVVYKVFGAGLYQGRILSLTLASAVLALILRFFKSSMYGVPLLAALFLAFDPFFAERAREIRYDFLAMLASLTAWFILARPTDRRQVFYHALAGVCSGIAVATNCLYMIFIPVYVGCIAAFPMKQTELLRTRLVCCLAYVSGSVVPLIPVWLYILRHKIAFYEQYLYQIRGAKMDDHAPLDWLVGESAKYIAYYRYSPLLLICSLVSILFLVRHFFLNLRPGAKVSPWPETQLLARLGAAALLIPILLSFASAHRPWHHLMAAPFWAMSCAIMVVSLYRASRSSFSRYCVIILATVTLLTAFSSAIVARTYSALSSWGARDITRFYPQLRELIPPKSSVFGDYRLILFARANQWDYVGCYFSDNVDKRALAAKGFHYLVLSDMTGTPVWLDMSKYSQIATVSLPTEKSILPVVNKLNVRIELKVFKLDDQTDASITPRRRLHG